MFTGIIAEVGTVTDVEPGVDSAIVTISAPALAPQLALGASVAVAGVCLTATEIAGESVRADVMRETLRATRLGELRPGDRVNLELALAAGARLDGHIVQGHVDGVATLASRRPGPAWEDLEFEIARPLGRLCAPKGSIALDGVSLTVTSVEDEGDSTRFGVSLIPTTLRATTLGELAVGQRVNVEVDVIAKYVDRLTAAEANKEIPQ